MTLFGHITNGFVVITTSHNEAAALAKTGFLGLWPVQVELARREIE